jgi:hypothetical protein
VLLSSTPIAWGILGPSLGGSTAERFARIRSLDGIGEEEVVCSVLFHLNLHEEIYHSLLLAQLIVVAAQPAAEQPPSSAELEPTLVQCLSRVLARVFVSLLPRKVQ